MPLRDSICLPGIRPTFSQPERSARLAQPSFNVPNVKQDDPNCHVDYPDCTPQIWHRVSMCYDPFYCQRVCGCLGRCIRPHCSHGCLQAASEVPSWADPDMCGRRCVVENIWIDVVEKAK